MMHHMLPIMIENLTMDFLSTWGNAFVSRNLNNITPTQLSMLYTLKTTTDIEQRFYNVETILNNYGQFLSWIETPIPVGVNYDVVLLSTCHQVIILYSIHQ